MARAIDVVIQKVRSGHPAVIVEQLKVVHPGVDDDGLWFFRLPWNNRKAQVESSTGASPFIVETDHAPPIHCANVDQAAAEVIAFLEANQSPEPTPHTGR